MKKTLFLFLTGLHSFAYCQINQHCTTKGTSDWIAIHPELAGERAALQQFTTEFEQNFDSQSRVNYTIPVVFHVNDPSNPQKVTMAQVQSALTILNQDFNAENPDFSQLRPEFAGIASNVGVTFCLATKDPNGNPTTGITYHYNNFDGRSPDGTGSDVKSVAYWPSDRYLNIWIVNTPEPGDAYTSGWAYLPSNWAQQNEVDGIIYNHRYLGYTGSSEVSGPNSWQAEMARVLTHEVGHYLNLDHTFENYCSSPGDNVGDTPYVYYHGSNNCEQLGEKCQGVTLVNDENYMDYTPCPSMFTNGQKTRMIAALNSSVAGRNNLWSASNMVITGCASIASLEDGMIQQSTVIVAPNPVESTCHFKVTGMIGNYTASITSVAGELLQSIYCTNTDMILNINDLAPGMYFLTVNNNSQSGTTRFLKN